jgi:hypothetical protein
MNHVGATLTARYRQGASRRSSATKHQSTIELPAEILALIDDKRYLNRHRMLYRLYPRELMELARIALTKPQPSHWYATVTKKTSTEGHEDHFIAVTLKWVRQAVLSVHETAARVAQKLGTEVTRFIYRQVWRGVNVERWADTAAEVGRRKSAYFTWLCHREMDARAGA